MGSAQQPMRLPDYPWLFFRKPGFRRPPPFPKWLLPAPCADWEGGAQTAFLLPWQTTKKP